MAHTDTNLSKRKPHTPHSRNRVVGIRGELELRKIEREIPLSRSSVCFKYDKWQIC